MTDRDDNRLISSMDDSITHGSGDGAKEFPESKKKLGRCGIIVEPLLILYLVAGFPYMSISSQFLVHKAADTLGINIQNISDSLNETDTCLIDKNDTIYQAHQQVSALASQWNMYKTLVAFIPALIAPLIFGALGDRIGRRMLMISPCIGSILSVSITMVIIKFDLPMWCILLTSVEDLFGGFGTLFTGAFAVISDTVPANKRPFRMTLIDAVAMGNAAIANLFVGYWIADQGFFSPLIFVLCGRIAALLYAIFCIPETLAKPSQGETTKKVSLLNAIKICIYDDGNKRIWKINTLLASFVIAELCSTFTIMTIWEMNTPLCWESVQIAYYTFGSIMLHCVCILAFSAIPKRFMSAEWKVVWSRVSGMLYAAYVGFVATSFMMYLAPILGCISFLAVPMTRYLLSLIVESHEQASVFATMGALAHLGMFANSMLINKLYQETLYILHGSLIFYAAAGGLFISLIIVLAYIYKKPTEGKGLSVSNPIGCPGSIQA